MDVSGSSKRKGKELYLAISNLMRDYYYFDEKNINIEMHVEETDFDGLYKDVTSITINVSDLVERFWQDPELDDEYEDVETFEDEEFIDEDWED